MDERENSLAGVVRERQKMTLAIVAELCRIDGAVLNFDRFNVAVNGKNAKALKMGTLSLDMQKSFLPYSACLTGQQSTFFWGFFNSAASDAIDNLLKSARCTGKIGDSLPLCYCLANLVKVSHNLFRLSGIMSKLWIELTRHAHLVSGNRYGAGSTRLVSIAPLSNLLS